MKRNKLLIHAITRMRKAARYQNVHTAYFHLYEILEGPNESYTDRKRIRKPEVSSGGEQADCKRTWKKCFLMELFSSFCGCTGVYIQQNSTHGTLKPGVFSCI